MASFNPYNEKSEKELAILIANGDEVAFKALYLSVLPSLINTGRKILKSEDIVCEVIQEALIRLWVHREKLRSVVSANAWVYRIFSNECFRYLKKYGLQHIPLDDVAEIDIYPTQVYNSTEQVCTLRETNKIIHSAVSTLSPRQREIYVLSREQGLKVSEIAIKLGLSNRYVKKTLTIALQNIRHVLAKSGKFSYLIGVILIVFE